MRYVTYKTLADWLGFSHETVRIWASEGKLDRHIIKNELHHSEDSVNAFLATIPQPGQRLQVEDFRRGVRLVTAKEAARWLGIEHVSLQTKISRKRFTGLRFESSWRFSTEALWIYKARRDNYITRDDVMHIFGCSQKVVSRWQREGILEPIQVRGAGLWRYFYKPEDVIRVIGEGLHLKVNLYIRQWLYETCASRRPPLTPAETMEYLGLSYAALNERIDDGDILFISLGGTSLANRRFSPVSVERALLNQRGWSPHDLQHVIGGTSAQINGWLQEELACTRHNHRGLAVRYACLAYILQPLLSPGIPARKWLAGREPGAGPLLTDTEVAEHFNLSVAHIHALAASGEFGGLRRPDGVWMFTPSRVNHASRKQLQGKIKALS